MFVENNWQWKLHTLCSDVSTVRRIAFVLSDACDLLGIGAIAEAFECACSLAKTESARSYDMRFLSTSGGHVQCDRSLFVSTDELANALETPFSRVFVAAGPHSRAVFDTPSAAQWLHRMRSNGTPVKFLATAVDMQAVGAAARSQQDDSAAASGYEQAQRRRAQLGNAIKAAFEAIRADFGESIAQEALHRTALLDASEWASSSDAANTAGERIRAAARWLRDNCHRSVCVADAAEACAMSQRTLLRNFQTYIGTSPSEYLQRVRLERACELLAETSLPADKVARHVGLASGDRLGKLFRRCIGKSPTEYRAWTQGKAQAEEERADRVASAEHSQRAFNVYSEGQPLNA